MDLNRHPDAIKAVQSGLAANPKSYALHLRLGAAYLAAGRYPEAESVFRDLVEAGDPLPTGYIGLAQVLLRTDRAEEAATELADAERKIRTKFLDQLFSGTGPGSSGQSRREALVAFREALQLNSNSAETHLNVGKIELAKVSEREAIAELQQALRLNPGDRQAERLLSQAYRRAGDAENAAKFAEASQELQSPSPTIWWETSSFRNGKLRPRGVQSSGNNATARLDPAATPTLLSSRENLDGQLTLWFVFTSKLLESSSSTRASRGDRVKSVRSGPARTLTPTLFWSVVAVLLSAISAFSAFAAERYRPSKHRKFRR